MMRAKHCNYYQVIMNMYIFTNFLMIINPIFAYKVKNEIRLVINIKQRFFLLKYFINVWINS